jgi:nitrilase
MNSVSDKAANIGQAQSLIERAVDLEGPDWICLPEHWNWAGGSTADKVKAADAIPGGPAYEAAQTLAAKHRVWLHAGSLLERAEVPHKVHNTTVVFDRSGREVARYRKIHLFDVELPGVSLTESRGVAPGKEVVVADTSLGKLGLSVCYDVRFPELYRALGELGAQILLVPSAFTVPTGRDHWEVLLRARAIENQCFVIAAAQVGRHGRTRETWGHSLIADPWGRVLVQASDGEGVAFAELDAGELERVRQRLPALRHRRLGG